MMPLEIALTAIPPTLNATKPIECCGMASSMIHFANRGGSRPITEPTMMQIRVSTSCFQYGKKNDPNRFQSTLRSIFGLSGLNIEDHIMWLGPPLPSIRNYNPLECPTVRSGCEPAGDGRSCARAGLFGRRSRRDDDLREPAYRIPQRRQPMVARQLRARAER